MKKIILAFSLVATGLNAMAQQFDNRVITTAAPFLDIPTSMSGLGRGNTGVATNADETNLYYNPAKMVFSKNIDNVSVSYLNWMKDAGGDMHLGNFTYIYKMDETQAVGGDLTYFTYGNMVMKDINGTELGNVKSNEFALRASYARALAYNTSASISLRGIYSKIIGGKGFNDQGVEIKPSLGVSADLSAYSFLELDFDNKLMFGLNISNLGSKMGYSNDAKQKGFLPTNLRLGVGYDKVLENANAFTLALDINKLMVPTPPRYAADGSIEKGKDPNRGLIGGMFGSFADAPGGIGEELREVMLSVGGEYRIQDQITFRGGLSYEDQTKGNRKFVSLGLGYKGDLYDQAYSLNVCYILPFGATSVQSPLKNVFGLTLSLQLGETQLY